MAIFITGDLHGDFSRFKKEIFYEQAELTKFKYWFFGHYHDDGVIGKNYVLLYRQIVEL